MIYLNMPLGGYYGWAVCGYNLAKELDKMTEVKYIEDGFWGNYRNDEMERLVTRLKKTQNGTKAPIIYCLEGDQKPKTAHSGSPKIGYTFNIDDNKDYIDNMRGMDKVIAGSKWCAELLKSHGLDSTSIPQGVNKSVFKYANKSDKLGDSFVVFSGGKYEKRKGQDLVLQAVSIMQKKHKDVILMTLWENIFDPEPARKQILKDVNSYKIENFFSFPMGSQEQCNAIMNQTDIGLFPNRVEGGTNLVLMEYLATGHPVIATASTGQADVLGMEYAFMLKNKSVDDIVSYLETAYKNRDDLKRMGVKASQAMDEFSWEIMAKRFLDEANC